MFYCKLCAFVHSKFNSYIKHLDEHSSLTTKLICGFNRCNKAYTVLTSLQSHVHRCHNIIQVTDTASSTVNLISESCTVESCSQKYIDNKQMITHLRKHIYDGTTVKCGYLNCEKRYNKLNSFSSHITKYHKEKTHAEQSSDPKSRSHIISFSNPILENKSDAALSSEELFQYNEDNSSDIFLTNLAHFFLKLEFKFSLPVSQFC